MKIRTGLFLIATGTILAVSVIGCQKKNTKEEEEEIKKDDDISAASDNSFSENIYNDAQNIADQASTGVLIFYSPTAPSEGKPSKELDFEKSSCATITHDTVAVPHALVIDFGTSNCLCNDGKNRRGKINVTYTGTYRDSASTHTITFTDYYVNDNQVLGTKTVTNNGHNADGNLNYSIHVDGQIIKANNGGTITWVSDRVREWLVGEGTWTWLDDVYAISGTASGTNASGLSYTCTITSPLRRALNCRWFDQGVLEIAPSGLAVRTIDYGTGDCDANATVTINGTSYPFVMY